jgi:SAM-dependent methyltransferase
VGARSDAAPGDLSYLLRDLDHTPCRFRRGPRPDAAAGTLEATVVEFVGAHPGATLNELRTRIAELGRQDYAAGRALAVRLVDEGALAVDGQAPLEEIDLRYERLAACDACGSPSEEHPIVLWKHNTAVVRCTGCGLLYANPRWKLEYLQGRYAEDYWTEYADKAVGVDPAASRARWAPLLDGLGTAGRPGRLLDVGCATGEFLLAARARGWEVSGLDISPIAAERARRLTGAAIHVGPLDTAPYPPASFDAITLWEVIEHAPSPRRYLARVAALLRPGGVVALSTPNLRSLAYRLAGREWSAIGPNEHLYYFAPRTIGRLLASVGLAVERCSTLGAGGDAWSIWLRHPRLQALAPVVRRLGGPIIHAFGLGETLYVIARRP